MDSLPVSHHSATPAAHRQRETVRVRETAAHRVERFDAAYTDASGRAFHLSIERETSAYSLTTDRRARVETGPEGGLAELRGALRELDQAVDGFKQRLHHFLKAVDPGYAGRLARLDPGLRRAGQERVEVHAVQQTVTVRLDRVDPEFWSVEATAGRLRDFAVGLFAGGDREEHAAAMGRAMELGYRGAEQAFGGGLPAIARRTVGLAKDLLAVWAGGDPARGVAPAEGLLDLVA
ncbi:MAG: hypothetical protein ACYDA8_12270 [Deferrisomatales bacterium]